MYIEIWKDIPGYEGLYMASTHGRIKSLDKYVVEKTGKKRFMKGKILKQQTTEDGYKAISLHKNGKNKKYLVHRLIALTFIPNPNNYPCINHKIDDFEHRSDNRVENLEWCDNKYNNNYGNHGKRISEANSGEKNHFYGKHHTEQSKKKMSESHANFKGKNHPKYNTGKPILMFTKDGQFIRRFDNIGQANEYLGKPRNSKNIGKCARGKLKSSFGYIWKYE